jgi:hypothetical protein
MWKARNHPNGVPNREECAMKLSDAQIEQALHQLDGEVIPAGHPVISQLERLYGNHTYFLDGNGLNIVEPVEEDLLDGRRGVVVNLANWANSAASSLQPHEPEVTELVVDLETRHH